VSRLNIASTHARNDAVFAKEILIGHLPARDPCRRKQRTPDDNDVAAILGGTFGRRDSPKFMRNATLRSEILEIAFNISSEAGWVAAPGSMR
jgi:hypothetical protein